MSAEHPASIATAIQPAPGESKDGESPINMAELPKVSEGVAKRSVGEGKDVEESLESGIGGKRSIGQTIDPSSSEGAAGGEMSEKNPVHGDTSMSASAEGDMAAGSSSSPGIQIAVAFKRQKFEIEVHMSDLISELKSKLEPLCGIPRENQKLMFKGMLQDSSTVEASGLKAGTKLMLIGSSKQEIAKEQLAAVVASVNPIAAQAAATMKTKLCEVADHKKIIDKGVPEGAMAGILGQKCRLFEVNNVLSNVLDKRGETVRLTFKLEDNQLWIGAKTRLEARIRAICISILYQHSIVTTLSGSS